MKVNIDREGCIGCGLCVEICPEVFRIADGDGLSEAYKSPDGFESQVMDAAVACPVEVIRVEQ